MNLFKYLTTLLIAPSLTFAQPVLAQKNEPEITKKMTMYAKPAIVRIMSVCRGTYTLYDKEQDNPEANEIDTIDIDLSFFGTGFLINPEGYIVTSSRVTQSKKDCQQSIARNVINKIKNNRYAYYNQGLTDNKLFNITENDIIGRKYDKGKFELDFGGDGTSKNEGEWHVHFSMTQSNPLLNVNSRPIEVLYSGREEGEKIKIHRDIAIIKVSMENAPTLKIADSNKIQDQDTVVVVGYPNAADLLGRNIELTLKSYLESSVQEGKISNRNKELEGGYPVLQVDIRVGEGNAGSPLINKDGEVVGMLVFNDSDEDSKDDNGRDVPLALPTSTLRRFIQQANATNIPGEVDLLYDKGLEKFWRGKYKEAKADFLQVKNLYPFHSEVDKLISEID